MYVSPISSFFSRGRSTPAMRAIYQPCRCLCLGLRLQMMRTTPWRLITLQCSQIGLTLLRTFTKSSYGRANIPAMAREGKSELAFKNTGLGERNQAEGATTEGATSQKGLLARRGYYEGATMKGRL